MGVLTVNFYNRQFGQLNSAKDQQKEVITIYIRALSQILILIHQHVETVRDVRYSVRPDWEF